MSLEIAVLNSTNATSVDQAVAIYMEEATGIPDESGELEAYAREVFDAYGDDDWPFAGDPAVEGGCCVHLTIAWDAWEAELPKLVERAHRRGLVVLDPQEERLFRPGDPLGADSS